MKRYLLRDGDFTFVLALPDDAPLEKLSGATLAQMTPLPSAPVRYSTGARLAHPKRASERSVTSPLLRGGLTGAVAQRDPIAAPPAKFSGARARSNPAEKIEYYRDEIKGLTAEKIGLAPIFDAHQALLKSTREHLQASHQQYPASCPVEVRDHRLSLHDRILDSSIERGRESRRYRDVDAMINTLSNELRRLIDAAEKVKT